MTLKQPNTKLITVMERARCSNNGLARRVIAIAALHGVELHTNHITVQRWRDGSAPRDPVPQFIAEALSRILSERLTPADIGMLGADVPILAASVDYPASWTDSVDRLAELGRYDIAGDPTIVDADISVDAWPRVMLDWFTARDEQPRSVARPQPHVGLADVEMIQETTRTFRKLDFLYGGGHARTALVQYFTADVTPMLHGTYTEAVGRELLSATALTARLLGWTAYDSGRHGLAQRYLLQALRLAKAAGDRLLCGCILSNLSHQANYLGYHADAAKFARIAQEALRADATPAAMALFLAMEARACATAGDEAGCIRALRESEQHFARHHHEDGPSWLQYFDESELAGEAAHCFRDLHKPELALEFASRAVDLTAPEYARTLGFVRMVHAAAQLQNDDIEGAVTTAEEAVTLGGPVKSVRLRRYVTDFTNDLTSYQNQPLVADFTRRMATLIPPLD